MNETDTVETRAAVGGSRLQRIVICFRWAWSWLGFWRGWWNEAKGVGLMAWMGLVGFVGAFMQLALVIVFPVWRLLIEPLKVGLTLTERQVANLRKILDR